MVYVLQNYIQTETQISNVIYYAYKLQLFLIMSLVISGLPSFTTPMQ